MDPAHIIQTLNDLLHKRFDDGDDADITSLFAEGCRILFSLFIPSSNEKRTAMRRVFSKVLVPDAPSLVQAAGALTIFLGQEPPAVEDGGGGGGDPAPLPPTGSEPLKGRRACSSCKPFIRNRFNEVINLPEKHCYTICTKFTLVAGKDAFLVDGDVHLARYRLKKIDEYLEHLEQKKEDNDDDDDGKLYRVKYCTNRQKRLVAYLKTYRHIYGKGKYGVRKDLPACVCLAVGAWWPDDADDRRIQGEADADEADADAYDLADLVAVARR